MKMMANQKGIQKAIQVLPDARVTTLKLILSNATVSSISLNELCKEAIDAGKQEFTAVLIEKGATPPRDKLRRLCGWPRAEVQPAIAKYLADNDSTRSSAPREKPQSPEDFQQRSHFQQAQVRYSV